MRQNLKIHGLSILMYSIWGLLILGVGGRLIMRVIAILGPVAPGSSFGGTLEVVTFGGILGLIYGLVYQLLYKWLPKSWIYQGLMGGLLLYLALVIIPFDSKNAALGFPNLMVIIHLLFSLLVLLFALVGSRFSLHTKP